MSTSSISSSELSKIQYAYSTNSSLLNNLTGNTDETDSTSILYGITDLDSYVSSSVSSVSEDATYTSELLKNNFNLTSLNNAIDTISNTASFYNISNLNEYVSSLIDASQSDNYETLSDVSSILDTSSIYASSNLSQSIINAYKSSSVFSQLEGSSIDTEV